jgi:hypothetical protein
MITRYTSIETNENADWRLCHNGGGYFQPEIEAAGTTNGVEWNLWMHDSSCGDFGSRIDAVLTVSNKSYNVQYGSMYEKDDLGFSEIPADPKIVDILDEIAEEMGYHIPTRFNYLEEIIDEHVDPDDPRFKIKVCEYVVDEYTKKMSDFNTIDTMVSAISEDDSIFIGKLTDELVQQIADAFEKMEYTYTYTDGVKYSPDKEYFLYIRHNEWGIFPRRKEIIVNNITNHIRSSRPSQRPSQPRARV